jgi:hypothetical protein
VAAGERVASQDLPDLDLDAAADVPDDSWEVVLALSDEVAWEGGLESSVAEGAEGSAAWSMTLGPSSIDRALLALSDEERAALGELLAEDQDEGAPTVAPQG